MEHLDPRKTGLVTMGNVSNCVIEAMRRAYNEGQDNVTVDLLKDVASQMTIARFNPIPIDSLKTLYDIHIIDGPTFEKKKHQNSNGA